jgi:hypothetical protein
MDDFRLLCRYIFGPGYCLLLVAMAGFAWAGLDQAIGTGYALAAIGVGLLLRFNVAVIVGLYLYAGNSLGLSPVGTILFAAPGVLMLMPIFVSTVFSLFAERRVRSQQAIDTPPLASNGRVSSLRLR